MAKVRVRVRIAFELHYRVGEDGALLRGDRHARGKREHREQLQGMEEVAHR
jgi:hypothetical protein